MRISISRSKNAIIYYGVESFREGGKVKTTVIRKFGSHAKLLKQHSDPEAWVRSEIERLNQLKKEKIESFDKQIDYSKSLDSCNNLETKSTEVNVGWVYLNEIYRQLKIDEFFMSIKGKEKYNSSELFKFLVTSRILNPKSKRSTIFDQKIFLGIDTFKLQEVYKLLPILSSNDELIQKHLFENTKQIINLETDVLFYDCTNFYCETEENDVDILGLDEESVLQYGLRKYGVSKEHRPNPIVQMGLFTDKNGIPIAYSIQPGNTNEQTTVRPIESRIVNQYKTSNFIYCADGGLNSSTIKFANSFDNRRYIVSQSLKKHDEEEINLILKDENWMIKIPRKGKIVEEKISIQDFKNIIIKYVNGNDLTEEEQLILKCDRIYKKFPTIVNVDLHKINPKAFKTPQIAALDEILYITFSAKQYLYQAGVFNKQLLRAKNILEHPSNIRKNPNDPMRFIVKNKCTDNGEVAKNEYIDLNVEQIEKEEKLLGYYCLATNIEDKTIDELLEINKKRWRIELNFRIMKSYLDTRPIYVSTYDAIRGHFITCYTALLVYSILESKLNEKGEHLTIGNIITTLKNINVIKEDEGYYKSIYTNSKTLERLEEIYNKGLNKKYYKVKQIEQLRK